MQPSPKKRLPERTHDAFNLPSGAVAARQAASAAQWLARFANSWLPAEPGNAQLLLRFDPERRVLVSRTAVAGLSLELSLAELAMQLLQDGTPSPHRMELQDRTPAHIEAWILVEMLHRDIDRSRFSKALPWAVSDLMNGDSEEFTPDSLVAELATLTRSFALAGETLAPLLGVEPAALTCSADNLHISVNLPSAGGVPATMAGLAPGDARTSEPYFYVARPLPRPNFSEPPRPVLTISEIDRRQLGPDAIAEALRAAVPALAATKAAE